MLPKLIKFSQFSNNITKFPLKFAFFLLFLTTNFKFSLLFFVKYLEIATFSVYFARNIPFFAQIENLRRWTSNPRRFYQDSPPTVSQIFGWEHCCGFTSRLLYRRQKWKIWAILIITIDRNIEWLIQDTWMFLMLTAWNGLGHHLIIVYIITHPHLFVDQDFVVWVVSITTDIIFRGIQIFKRLDTTFGLILILTKDTKIPPQDMR